MHVSATSLLDRRLLLFTGKGGVGKTTLVAALALEAARRGRRPLVVELGHRASMEAVFEVDHIGYEPRDVGRGVHAMNLDFESALGEYFEEHIPIKRVARTIMRNKTLQKFFHAAPSVSEVAILNKLSALENARAPGGSTMRWDPIFVDLDATGHAIMLLNLPSVMDGLIGDGPMRRMVDGFSSLLSDPRRTILSLVTLPLELPAQETVELHQQLTRHHDVALGVLFVNQVPRRPLSPTQAGMLDRLEHHAREFGIDTLVDDVAIARRAMRYHANARSQINRLLREVDMPMVELPSVAGRVLDLDTIAAIGEKTLTLLDSGQQREETNVTAIPRR
ncbi:Arsenical pump-driving ATPase [Enhygromyxa salina]|uniref:arsenite-transporting ATPase n=1 Tax=Enhygromyxa salina TaxID=215803 RepID=A0A2S9YCC5_9BACT|nr:ArsA-related P-loop ATPase [Enhygromyxa salina]PRQ02767.1 Arsenical pump-driving ATPase [Enhygromyxa salina]